MIPSVRIWFCSGRFWGFLLFFLKVHVQLTWNHTVIELSAFICHPTKGFFKFHIGADDIITVPDIPAKRPCPSSHKFPVRSLNRAVVHRMEGYRLQRPFHPTYKNPLTSRCTISMRVPTPACFALYCASSTAAGSISLP